MLAASAVAAEAGDLATARARAHAACSLAAEANQADAATTSNAANTAAIWMWATWQEGRVALVTGDTDDALASFGQAAAADPSGVAAEPIRMAGQLATRVEDLRRRQESHREAEAMLRHAEHQTLNELLACVRAPGQADDGIPGADRWSRAPALLKMPGLAEPRGGRAGWLWPWTRLRARLHGRHSVRAQKLCGECGNVHTRAWSMPHPPPDGSAHAGKWRRIAWLLGGQPPTLPAARFAAMTVPQAGLRTRRAPTCADGS